MKVAFRVDASQDMGTGHVYRCLALASSLQRRNAEIVFLTRRLGLRSADLIRDAGFPALELPEPEGPPPEDPDVPHAAWGGVPMLVDAVQSVARLHDFQPDWVVVDSYAFDARWHEMVRDQLHVRVAAIDDMADKAFGCDLLIDHNHAPDHRAKYQGRLSPSTPLLGGPTYALLRPVFADGPRYSPREKVDSVGVFLGGVDRSNLSAVALEALAESGFAGEIEVVSTAANPNLEALGRAIARRPNTRLSLNLPDLADFFARHDVQIGAGGGSSWERCCIGAPTLLLVTAVNQMAVAPELVRHGVVAGADPLDTVDVAALASALSALIHAPDKRRSLSEKSRALVDGRGAERVAEEMLK